MQQQAHDAILMWDDDISGATIALVVDKVSPSQGERAFRTVGFDSGEGRGFLVRDDGSRVMLPKISPDQMREALALNAVCVMEIEIQDKGKTFEYPVSVEALDLAPAPGF